MPQDCPNCGNPTPAEPCVECGFRSTWEAPERDEREAAREAYREGVREDERFGIIAKEPID